MTLPACPDTANADAPATVAHPAATATLLAACLAFGAIAMTITSSSVALAGLQASMQLGITELQWVLNSFIVSFALLLLPFGRWSDRAGQRRLFQWGALTFVIGAIAAVLAPDMSTVIAGRSLQGVGAALLTATAPAALTMAFALEADRKRAFGYLGASGGIGLTLGALLAGAASSWGGWRAAFSLPIPVIMAAFFIVLLSPEALPSRRASPALDDIPTRTLLRNRQFVLSCVICLLFTTVWVALFIYAPLHMQTVDGLDPGAVGVIMLALLLPALVMPIAASRLALMFRVHVVLIAGFVAIALGLWLIDLAWTGVTSRALEVAGLILCGTGAGTLYGLVDYLGLTTVPAQQAGLASGAFNVVRLSGDILAAILPGAVLLHVVGAAFAPGSGQNLSREMLSEIAAGDLRAAEHLGLLTEARTAFANGMHWAIWALIGIAITGAAVATYVDRQRERLDRPAA
jgi:MFS family permease